MGPIAYKNKALRFPAALVAGFYMVIHGTRFDIQRALKSPLFYVVVAISCVAAWLLVESVHYVTKRLDVNYGWRSRFAERVLYQFLLGVVVPFLLDLSIFSIYFTVLGQSIFENGFFHSDLPFVLMLLVVLNGYYYIHYIRVTDERYVRRRLAQLTQAAQGIVPDSEPAIFVLRAKGQHIHFKIDEILFFYRHEKDVCFATEDGKRFTAKQTINDLENQYKNNGFLRINRGTLINRKIITGYVTGERKNTLQLIINKKYQSTISEPEKTKFEVTKEYISDFKELFLA